MLFCHHRFASVFRRNLRSFKVQRMFCANVNLDTDPKNKSCAAPNPAKKNPILQFIIDRIRLTGPITVAEYMKIALTAPGRGYYMTRDIFGKGGDFITSPVVCQIFGELLAVWIAYEAERVGQLGKPLQIVELGPGTGIMMSDILKNLSQLKRLQNVSVHLVELSCQLADRQEELLCPSKTDTCVKIKPGRAPVGHFKTNKTNFGPDVFWYSNFRFVPNGFSIILAHEFFDALPIHKFQRTADKGWKEVLVDIDPGKEGSLRFVLSSVETITQRAYLTPAFLSRIPPATKQIEFCPEALALIQVLSNRITEYGGAVLTIDYGYDKFGEKEDTFRGFKDHAVVEPLQDVGLCDLTADVNFAHLKATIEDHVSVAGPISQGEFLRNLGIKLRQDALLEMCTNEEDRTSLLKFVELLTQDKDNAMGERFKVMALYPKVLEKFKMLKPSAGF